MQVKYLALARQEVVLNVEPVHGFEMALKNGSRNQIRNRRRLVVPFFNQAQHRGARMQVRLVLFIPLGDAGIEIPAVVIEAGRGGERFNLSARLLFDMQESNHHVGDLHSGVVDVVLDVHFPARKAQQADEGIAENGVAQVPDMRRLVGIDARMLDQHFAGGNIRGGFFVGGERRGQLGAAYANVDVPAAGHLEFFKARNRTDPGDDLFGNLARRLAEFPGEFESDRQRVLAKFDFRRLLDDDVRAFQVVSTTQKLAQMFDQRRSRYRYKMPSKLLKKQ